MTLNGTGQIPAGQERPPIRPGFRSPPKRMIRATSLPRASPSPADERRAACQAFRRATGIRRQRSTFGAHRQKLAEGADRETHDAVPRRGYGNQTMRKKARTFSYISEEIGIAPRSPERPCHGATVPTLASILEPSSQASCEVRKYEFDLRTQASISSSRISQPYGLSWSEQDVTLRRNRDGPGRRVPSWPNVCCFILKSAASFPYAMHHLP